MPLQVRHILSIGRLLQDCSKNADKQILEKTFVSFLISRSITLAKDAVAHYVNLSAVDFPAFADLDASRAHPANTVEFRFVNSGGTGPGKLVEFST
jgi:hypothetical protein